MVEWPRGEAECFKVKPGDELTVQFGQKLVTVRVERISESARKEEASEMYTILKEEGIGSL